MYRVPRLTRDVPERTLERSEVYPQYCKVQQAERTEQELCPYCRQFLCRRGRSSSSQNEGANNTNVIETGVGE